MIKTNKIISVIIAVMMLLSSVAVFAEETQTATITFSDLDANTLVGKAVAELVPFGIINGYEDGTFRQDNTITRAEFSKIITTFLNMQNVGAEGLASGFPDVDTATPHWGQKYIRLAVDRGIVKGYEDGTFRPDSPVKYSEAVKMTVCALGWGDVAASRTVAGSPWYAGYVAQAGDLGLLKNVSINSQEDPASRGMVAILISNALDANTATTNTTVGGATSTQSSGTTAREDFLKSTKITGIVVGCQQTSIDGESTKNNARLIAVDTGKEVKTYKVPTGTDTMALLGYKISANINEDSADDYEEIKAIQKVNTNKVTVVDGTLISSVSERSLSYWESDTSAKERSINYDSDMAVVYNGVYLASYSAADFNIKAGNIVFVSNDGDASADVAFINNCEIFAVSSSGTDSATKLKKIYTLYGGGDIIVPDTGKFVKVVNKGTEVEDTTSFSVSKYDIINLYRSKDNTVFDMTVTRNRISGSIDSLSADEITIKGKDYKFAYNFAEYTGSDKPVFKTRNNANVYLDADGRIAAAENVNTSADSSVYVGYLLYGEAGEGIGAVSQLKLYGMTGKTGERTYTIAKRVMIDGTQYDTGALAIEALEASATLVNSKKSSADLSSTHLSQIIRYTLNQDNEIDTIDTPAPNVTTADDDLVQSLPFPNTADASYDEATFNQEGKWNGSYKYVSGNKFVNNSNGTVMGINSSTKVLVVPKNVDEIKNYRNTSSSYFSALIKYRVEGYCMNDSKIAQYVIVYPMEEESEILPDSNVVLTGTVTSAQSDNDETSVQDKLTGWNFKNGSEVSDLRSENAGMLYGAIQTGEIFRYVLDDKYVSKVEMLFEIEGGEPVVFRNLVKDDETEGATFDNVLIPVASSSKATRLRDIRFDSSTKTLEASTSRFIYGTVITKNEDDDGSNRVLTLTNTLVTDECGIVEDAVDIFNLSSSTKIFIIDTSATREDKIVTTDVDFNELRAYSELGATEDKANASQVLMYYASGTIRSIAIIR